MNGVTQLLENFWIIKDRDKEKYFELRSCLKDIEKFGRDYAGWRLISNDKLIRYEKIPAKAHAFMGIESFQDKLDYLLLLSLLIFLEDLEDEESFLLSELVDMIEIQMKGRIELDWTSFLHRKSLVRMMKYAESAGLINRQDGDLDQEDIRREVLYENTGLSRYFAVNYAADVTQYRDYRDFETADEMVDTDRGYSRINRVYRTLATCPAMYWENQEDADSLYLKNQRQWVSKYLSEYLGARIDIHRNAAFLIPDGETFGDTFPTGQMITDVILLLAAKIRESAPDRGPDDTVLLSKVSFLQMIDQIRKENLNAWSKEFRELPVSRLQERVLREMGEWMMLKDEGENVRLYPGAFKFTGAYPKDFDPMQAAEETDMETPSGSAACAGNSEPQNRRKGKKDSVADGQMSLFEVIQ